MVADPTRPDPRRVSESLVDPDLAWKCMVRLLESHGEWWLKIEAWIVCRLCGLCGQALAEEVASEAGLRLATKYMDRCGTSLGAFTALRIARNCAIDLGRRGLWFTEIQIESGGDDGFGRKELIALAVEGDDRPVGESKTRFFRILLAMLTRAERLVLRSLRRGVSKQKLAASRGVTVRRIEQVMQSIEAKARVARIAHGST